MTTGAIEWTVWRDINGVLQAYADALDRADVERIVALFTDDAVWDYRPGAPLHGREAIAQFFRGADVFQRTSHHVGPPRVTRSPADDGYQSIAYFVATHLLRDGARYTVYGRYVDTFHTVGSTLLIAHRRVIAHVTEGTDRAYHDLQRQPPS